MSAKFYLYRNLHIKTGGFSIKRKGVVVARDTLFTMRKVSFKINEIGRNKVREQKQKNVHAFIVSKSYERPAMVTWCVHDVIEKVGYKEISYNPYGENYFFVVETNKPIERAKHVICLEGKVYAYG